MSRRKTIDEENLLDEPLGAATGGQESDQAIGKQIAFAGRLGGMNRREASSLLRSFQASVVDLDADEIDWVVIGADEPPLAETELLDQSICDAAAAGKLEILHETELWQRLGLVEIEESVRRYYTPAMLAHLLDVSVHVIRRWQRRGLITPVRTFLKLPYFDFQEVATARRLADWVASGASPQAIESHLVELMEVLPDLRRPLDQLSILVEGKQILLRQGDGLVDIGGQLRFDFDAADEPHLPNTNKNEPHQQSIVSIPFDDGKNNTTGRVSIPMNDELLTLAYDAEDVGNLSAAIDYYHAVLARDGPRADISFQLGELLYRQGYLIAARERFYAAIELDADFVEARASLGGVLAETGQSDLAVAAYRGALVLHDEYPDVHYNLARILDQLGRRTEARQHWNRFIDLAPNSPWADEARIRLDENELPI